MWKERRTALYLRASELRHRGIEEVSVTTFVTLSIPHLHLWTTYFSSYVTTNTPSTSRLRYHFKSVVYVRSALAH